MEIFYIYETQKYNHDSKIHKNQLAPLQKYHQSNNFQSISMNVESFDSELNFLSKHLCKHGYYSIKYWGKRMSDCLNNNSDFILLYVYSEDLF